MSLAPIVTVATRSSQQFSSLLGTVPDPDVEAVGNWSVRDVAGHVAGAKTRDSDGSCQAGDQL